MAARKPAARRKPPDPCPTCKGSGEVETVVRVGRRRQQVGYQTGMCLTCFGSGTAEESSR